MIVGLYVSKFETWRARETSLVYWGRTDENHKTGWFNQSEIAQQEVGRTPNHETRMFR